MTGIFHLGIKTPERAVTVLSICWIALLISNIFLFDTGINTPMNFGFILLTTITIIIYFLGKRYFKNRK